MGGVACVAWEPRSFLKRRGRVRFFELQRARLSPPRELQRKKESRGGAMIVRVLRGIAGGHMSLRKGAGGAQLRRRAGYDVRQAPELLAPRSPS